MLTHKQIWNAIDALAARSGHSPSGLARAAGLDPTTFNKSKRHGPQGRLRWPSTESLAKVLQVTGASLEEFVALISRSGTSRAAPRRRLPFLNARDALTKGVFAADGAPAGRHWGSIAVPDLDDDKAFTVEIGSDAAAPVIRSGEIIVASPAATLKRGDRVLVKTANELLVMGFVRRTAKRVELTSLNPLMPDRVIDADRVEWLARIVWSSH